MSMCVQITVVAVPHVEVTNDDTRLRSNAFDEVSKLGDEDAERLGVGTGRWQSMDNEQL